MGLVKVWDKEIKGKLYAVGDIHGCYNLLMSRLNVIGFDFKNDLLVAVGDLVDRGIQNQECIALLDQPWFASVKGNHEDLVIMGAINKSYYNCHIQNGGEWFYGLDYQAQQEIIKKFSVHDKFHRTLILSGFCFLKIAKISLNSSFFPKPIKR